MPSSSIVVDADNLARSFAGTAFLPGGVHGVLQGGAEVRNSHGNSSPLGFSGDSYTRTTIYDHWSCLPTTCAGVGAPGVPVSLALTIGGSTTIGSGSSFDLAYSISSGGSFSFVFFQDPDPYARAAFRDPAGVETELPVTLATNAGGDLEFSLDISHFFNLLCPSACSAGFDDELSLNARVYSQGDPEHLDAFHTFSVDLVSLDPNVQFVSDSGRTTSVQSTAAPEPETLSLLGLGLLALTFGGSSFGRRAAGAARR